MCLWGLASVAGALAVYIIYFTVFKPASDQSLLLQEGAHYTQETIVQAPNNKAVIHRITIDLNVFNIRLTPPEQLHSTRPHRAITTTTALLKYGADIAMNTSFLHHLKMRIS